MFNVAKNNRTDNRLEEYILENLERISLDQDYIDNLVFKLNHGLKSLNPEFKSSSPPHRAGYEIGVNSGFFCEIGEEIGVKNQS